MYKHMQKDFIQLPTEENVSGENHIYKVESQDE